MFNYFLVVEGRGSGTVKKTYGAGFRRPKNLWNSALLWIRIRTVFNGVPGSESVSAEAVAWTLQFLIKKRLEKFLLYSFLLFLVIKTLDI
jgi:hypothetical protein